MHVFRTDSYSTEAESDWFNQTNEIMTTGSVDSPSQNLSIYELIFFIKKIFSDNLTSIIMYIIWHMASLRSDAILDFWVVCIVRLD
jgi:hypothetical protein